MNDDDDDELRQCKITENVARALGKTGAHVRVKSGRILAFKPRPRADYYLPDTKGVLASLGPVEPRIIRNRIRCRKCDTVIESTDVHDFVECPCGAVFVDGGHEYQRIGGEPVDYENLSEYRDE